MNLSQAKINTPCVVKSVEVKDQSTQIRLMELGLTAGTKIVVKHKSVLKKTMLISFAWSCFTIKDNIASQVEVEYV